ncbi:hypothetical protein H4R26_000715 [Coemansia thaxteri]|uniref:lytic cellulose monooxygenase (C4-dehydrogenating) n=1 Tax=Coemansia thaxteri TaxID=2663907 RepID=A0A9W8ELV4_9FUNG|nr:hypothetical protein H4R26_000715 [Coemansia thaxteri]KAJ2487802.1 hypothetical protein EV174_000335 [Coemansia sp. RSA 2320]
MVALVAAVFRVASAHTSLYSIGINGETNPKGKYILPYDSKPSHPVRDATLDTLRCRDKKGTSQVTESLQVVAGTQLTVEWHHYNSTETDNVISPSHRGPCLIYMAPLESNGEGFAWFKIYEQGFDAARNMWCTDIVRENHGKLSVTIPTQINNGDYLVRAEIISLHHADLVGGAQFFPNCAKISVTGATYGKPDLYAIPGIYGINDTGILFDRHKGGATYKLPGPPVYAP